MVNKVNEEKETGKPKNILSEVLSSILEEDVTFYAPEESPVQKAEDYVCVYRGEALNDEELFQLSAREKIRQVLIAGPYSSGKTTLIVMMYFLFLEGRNRVLKFGGSLTINGFKQRLQNLLLSSGEEKPIVERTPRTELNRYLHLNLEDHDGRKDNLILTDVSGELFCAEDMESLSDLYLACENVILILDGEKIVHPRQRQRERMTFTLMLRNLLKNGIITKNSKVQIVCTKKDLIDKGDDSKETYAFLEDSWNFIQSNYEALVDSLEFYTVSALTIEDEETQNDFETIILRCLEIDHCEVTVPHKKPKLQRFFDKYEVRE